MATPEHAFSPHAARRLRERYDSEKPREHYFAIREKILAGKCKAIGPAKNDRYEFRVYWRGRHVRAVWDEALQQVVTVLPERRRRGHGDGE